MAIKGNANMRTQSQQVQFILEFVTAAFEKNSPRLIALLDSRNYQMVDKDPNGLTALNHIGILGDQGVCELMALYFIGRREVYSDFAVGAASLDNEALVYGYLDKVNISFRSSAVMLAVLRAAQHNHTDLVFKLLMEVDPFEHWDVAAVAYCAGHHALAAKIFANRPETNDEEEMMEGLSLLDDPFTLEPSIDFDVNTFSPSYQAVCEENRRLRREVEILKAKSIQSVKPRYIGGCYR